MYFTMVLSINFDRKVFVYLDGWRVNDCYHLLIIFDTKSEIYFSAVKRIETSKCDQLTESISLTSRQKSVVVI